MFYTFLFSHFPLHYFMHYMQISDVYNIIWGYLDFFQLEIWEIASWETTVIRNRIFVLIAFPFHKEMVERDTWQTNLVNIKQRDTQEIKIMCEELSSSCGQHCVTVPNNWKKKTERTLLIVYVIHNVYEVLGIKNQIHRILFLKNIEK